MKNILNVIGIFLGGTSIFIVIALAILLITTVIIPDLIPFDSEDPLMLSFVSAVLFFISAVAFTLSSMGSNLMIMASSKKKEFQGIGRILMILLFSPILVLLLVFPFLLIILLSFIYGDFARYVIEMFLPSADSEAISSIVTFFIISESLYAAYKYNLFGWYLSPKKGSSINLAESQFREVYDNVEGIWKTGAGIVRLSIRATAFALVLIILWSAIRFSGVMQIDFSLENLPAILIAGIFGIIPFLLIRGIKIKQRPAKSSVHH